MKAELFDLQGKKLKELELPEQFNEEVREDLIKRAVLAVQSNKRQRYGAKIGAGTRQVINVSRRRHIYKSMYGTGMSRVPRKKMSRRGTQINYVGAFAPGMRGGRKAHPPKASKIYSQKINKKERRKAIRSALAGLNIKVIESKIENINKTKDAKQFLEKLNFKKELERTKEKTIRPGKGKVRGRKYRKKKGPLLVFSEQCKSLNSFKNIPGLDLVIVNNLNAELLAPSAKPGRNALFSEKAIEKMKKENLFSK